MVKTELESSPIIKSFEFWTQTEEGRGFRSAWQLDLLTKALYLDGLKTASFFRESGVPLSLCVCMSVNTDPVPDKDGGWRDNRYPECNLLLSDEKVSVANLWTNRRHTNGRCIHTLLVEEIE